MQKSFSTFYYMIKTKILHIEYIIIYSSCKKYKGPRQEEVIKDKEKARIKVSSNYNQIKGIMKAIQHSFLRH